MAREKKYSWTKFSWRLFSGIQLRFAINNQTTVTVNRRKCTAITSLNFMQPMHHLCLLVSKHADIHWCISPIHWCLLLCTVGFHNPLMSFTVHWCLSPSPSYNITVLTQNFPLSSCTCQLGSTALDLALLNANEEVVLALITASTNSNN